MIADGFKQRGGFDHNGRYIMNSYVWWYEWGRRKEMERLEDEKKNT